MTKYLSSSPFSTHAPGDQQYRDNWEAIFAPKPPAMIPLGKTEVRFNGGVQCDMLVGPCACGATHHELEEPVVENYEDPEDEDVIGADVTLTPDPDQCYCNQVAICWACLASKGHTKAVDDWMVNRHGRAILRAEDDASERNWNQWVANCAVLGWNEIVKLCPDIESKVLFRQLRDHAVDLYYAEGGTRVLITGDDNILELEWAASMPKLKFRASDIESMRRVVTEYDANQPRTEECINCHFPNEEGEEDSDYDDRLYIEAGTGKFYCGRCADELGIDDTGGFYPNRCGQ